MVCVPLYDLVLVSVVPQVEMETMNLASSTINKLSTELEVRVLEDVCPYRELRAYVKCTVDD